MVDVWPNVVYTDVKYLKKRQQFTKPYIYAISETPIHQNFKFWQIYPSESPIVSSDVRSSNLFTKNALCYEYEVLTSKFWWIGSSDTLLSEDKSIRNSNLGIILLRDCYEVWNLNYDGLEFLTRHIYISFTSISTYNLHSHRIFIDERCRTARKVK